MNTNFPELAIYVEADKAFARATVLMQAKMSDKLSCSKLLKFANVVTRAAVAAASINDKTMASVFLDIAETIDTYVIAA